MKPRIKSKTWPPAGQNASQSNDLEKDLTKALDQSNSDLSDRFDAIVRRHKSKLQTDQHA